MVADRLSPTFAALADPTRRAILARLVEGEATVNQLAEPFAMSLPAISKHIKVLESAGLVERGRHRQTRPCRIRPEPLQEAAGFLAEYRQLWEERLDRLEAYLQNLQAQSPETPRHAGME